MTPHTTSARRELVAVLLANGLTPEAAERSVEVSLEFPALVGAAIAEAGSVDRLIVGAWSVSPQVDELFSGLMMAGDVEPIWWPRWVKALVRRVSPGTLFYRQTGLDASA